MVISEDETPISWSANWSADLDGLQAYDPGVHGGSTSVITNWSVGAQPSSGSVIVSGNAG